MKRILVQAIFLITLASSCTMTTTTEKAPVFKTSIDNLQVALNSLVKCEHINLSGEEIKEKDQQSKTLIKIDILNGKGIPTSSDQLKNLGKQIAASIKSSLQDQDEYDVYKVLFIDEKKNGSITERDSKNFTYSSKELL